MVFVIVDIMNIESVIDEDPYYFKLRKSLSFVSTICNGFIELIPKLNNGQNHNR